MSSSSTGEETCRQFLQDVFGAIFPKTRPKFLINPLTGSSLELDGYNPNLGIAFEYNGIQHYEYTPYYHKCFQDFLDQKRRDRVKINTCKRYGILLIVIPYYIDDTQSYIADQLVENGFAIYVANHIDNYYLKGLYALKVDQLKYIADNMSVSKGRLKCDTVENIRQCVRQYIL